MRAVMLCHHSSYTYMARFLSRYNRYIVHTTYYLHNTLLIKKYTTILNFEKIKKKWVEKNKA